MTEAEQYAVQELQTRYPYLSEEAAYTLADKTLEGRSLQFQWAVHALIAYENGFLWRFFDTILRLGSR